MVGQKNKLTLDDAVKLAGPDSIAILYAPKFCIFARSDGKNLEYKDIVSKGVTVDLKEVYEARIFNERKEVRWRSDGTILELSDQILMKPAENIITLTQNYVLWGEFLSQVDDNWTTFAEARIGKFDVPVAACEKGEYARIVAKEYLKESLDGNVAFLAERLVRIETCEAEAANAHK